MESFYSSFLFWLLAIVGVLLTGISKSGFAGGAGVVAVPILALVMPVPQAAALMLPLLIVMDIKAIQLYRQHINKRVLFSIIPAALAVHYYWIIIADLYTRERIRGDIRGDINSICLLAIPHTFFWQNARCGYFMGDDFRHHQHTHSCRWPTNQYLPYC